MSTQWPKVGVILLNSGGQTGYQYLPTNICKKLSNLVKNNNNFNNNNKKLNSNENNMKSIETIVFEMIFGSVALTLCAQNSSKLHKLNDDLLMTSFVFNVDFSNGKTCHRKYGLALIWDINECDGQLRQLLLKDSVIVDSLINQLKTDLIDSRLKTQKDIHKSVTKFMKSIDDYLSVCRLTSNISDDQFVDELMTLINNYDTKVTHFFVSTLLTSILMFKYRSEKMKLILWSNDVNKVSIISQLLVVIHQFLKTKSKTKSYLSPQMKSIKFCRNLNINSIKRTSSVTPITKSIISERKSRDESLGYESLTESGSTTTSTICDYSGFAYKTLDASTPLEHSMDGLDPESCHQMNGQTNDTQSSTQLNKSRNYFREYRNLRFTSNQISDDSTDEDIDCKTLFTMNCRTTDEMSDSDSQSCSHSSKDDDFGSDGLTDVEEIRESTILSGFGEISFPELIPDSNAYTNDISLSQSPAISNVYLSQIAIQGIINSKTINTYEDMISECLKKSLNDLKDNTIIVCDCDHWRINYVESSRCSPAIMSSTIGQVCETITELTALRMHSHFIRQFIDNKINELTVKSIVLKRVIENSCVDSHSKQKCIKLFDRDSKQSLLSLIADNYFNDFSSNDCISLGFDVSDIPVIIALKRHSLLNDNYMKHYDRNETHFLETNL